MVRNRVTDFEREKAKEILEYCYGYLILGKKKYLKGIFEDIDELDKFNKTKLYKDMMKEIVFMMTTD